MSLTVLIISIHADPSMPPGVGEWGGTHIYMKELLLELSSTDCRVILVTRRAYQEQPQQERINDSCCIYRIDLGSFGYFDKRCLFGLHDITVNKIEELWTTFKFKPNLIHSVYWNSGHAATKLTQKYNIPFVHSVISNGKGRNAKGASNTAANRIETEEKVFALAEQIICVAESEKQEIIDGYRIEAKKIIVAGQYVHPSFLYPAHDSFGRARSSSFHQQVSNNYFAQNAVVPEHSVEDKIMRWWTQKSFIYVGRISLDKGLHYIIEAWCSLYIKHGEQCPSMWIVGGSPDEIATFREKITHSEFSATFEDAENRMKLIWWGYLDEYGISTLYLKSAVLVTHSRYEPGGRVAIEAMSEGLPVIATPNGFALDSITNWKNGFLVEYQNVDDLAARMEHFIVQPILSASMGMSAKQCANNIRQRWNFLNSHLRAYSYVSNDPFTLEEDVVQPEYNYFVKRYFATYPICNTQLDQIALIDELKKCSVTDFISIVDKTFETSSTSFVMFISGEKINYVAKIPYTRIRIKPLYDDHCTELVMLAEHRYKREIFAGTIGLAAPIVNCNSSRYMILRKQYKPYTFSSPIKFLEDSLKIILSMYSYNTILWNPTFISLNNMFDSNMPIHKIKNEYLKIQAMEYNLAHDTIFSIRYEWRWIIQKDLKIRDIELSDFVKKYILIVSDIFTGEISKEKELPVVLANGDLSPEHIVVDNDQIFSIDHDTLHVAWIGRDYANSIIHAAGESTDPVLWEQLIQETLKITAAYNHFPYKLLVCWIITLILHELIMLDRLIVDIPQFRYLHLEILQELLVNPY